MKAPRFELTRVFEDGTQTDPEIVPVNSLPWDTKTSRRGFLGVGLLASSAFLALGGCAVPKNRNFKVWDEEAKKWRYNEVYDKVTKTWKSSTLPCGSPIPPGAICTCNCVPVAAPRPTYTPSYRTVCTCNRVCTCVPVRYPSDVALKTNVAPVDSQRVLEKLLMLPIQSWNYRSDAATIRHIGPMAQDFSSAFAVGGDTRHIDVVDANGVAFAAIQALHGQIRKKDAEISEQAKRIGELETRLEAIERSRVY